MKEFDQKPADTDYTQQVEIGNDRTGIQVSLECSGLNQTDGVFKVQTSNDLNNDGSDIAGLTIDVSAGNSYNVIAIQGWQAGKFITGNWAKGTNSAGTVRLKINETHT